MEVTIPGKGNSGSNAAHMWHHPKFDCSRYCYVSQPFDEAFERLDLILRHNQKGLLEFTSSIKRDCSSICGNS